MTSQCLFLFYKSKAVTRAISDVHGLEPVGYVEWHAWAKRQVSKGRQQKKCPCCNRFYFLEAKSG